MVQLAVTHFGYLEDVLGVRAAKNPSYFDSCIDVMKGYEARNDLWWLYGKDSCELANRQIDERILLIPFDVFKDGLTKVLKRSVSDSEISFTNKALVAEFKEKFKEYISEKKAS